MPDQAGRTERASETAGGRRQARIAWAVAAVLLLSTVALGAVLALGGDVPEPPKISFEIDTSTAPSPLHVSVSPDGARVAAIVTTETGQSALWVRALENLSGQVMPRTEGAQFPFWSPDGRTIGFFADGKLKKVDLLGAPPQTLSDAAFGHGATWNGNGIIVFAPTQASPLFQVAAAGGIPVQVTELDASQAETAHRHPFFLPDGDHFLYTAISSKPEQSAVYVGSLSSPERKRLVPSTLKAQFAPPGHLLFMRDNSTLLAQRFDPERVELSGEPFPAIAQDIGVNLANSAAGFSTSANGILAYRSGSVAQRVLTWLDSAGRPLSEVGPTAPYQSPAISPDGQRVAVFRDDGGAGDIWLFDLLRGTSSRFTFDGGIDTAPVWSPDGNHIVFSSNRAGVLNLYRKNAGGVGQEELLLKSDQDTLADDWSQDGRFILYRVRDQKTAWDVWVLPIDGDRKPQPFLQAPFNERQGRFSPDGRFIAYVSDESGRNEVYVQTFPASGSKWQISTAGGVQPRWRKDGKSLLFMSTSREAMAVSIDTVAEGSLRAGVPQRLFSVNPANLSTERNSWDMTPDGQRFLVNSTGGSGAQQRPIAVVVNWLAGQGRP